MAMFESLSVGLFVQKSENSFVEWREILSEIYFFFVI